MKVLCPACERLGELEKFRVDGARLFATCARCGVESMVETREPGIPAPAPSAPPAVQAPSAPPPPNLAPRPSSFSSSPVASNVVTLRTPHITAVEKAAEAAEADPFAVPDGLCPRCLALRGRADSCPACGLAFSQVAPSTLTPVPWLATAWRQLLEGWGDEGRHEALRRLAYEREELAALGRLYRIRLSWAPDDPFATKGRDEVLRLALVPVAVRPEPGPKRTQPWQAALLVMLLVGVAFFVTALIYQLVKSNSGTSP
jgi:hypothetical protein